MSLTISNAPSFGGILRGKRLGWGWSEKFLAFVRISGDGPFLVEVHPGPIPPSELTKESHRAWWESPIGGADLLAMIKNMPANPRQAAVFYADDLGNTVP